MSDTPTSTDGTSTDGTSTDGTSTDGTTLRAHEGDGRLTIDDLTDRIDALRVLRADNPDEAGRVLEELGGRGKPEQDIVDQLAKIRPLWRPDRFEEAHRVAMRSLEVLDRNGARNARMPRMGPLKPVAEWATQQVTRYIVRSHQNTVIDRVRKLYERREANSVWGSPEHVMLRRARINAVQVEGGFKSKALGLPTFLLGGAFLSSIIGALGRAVSNAIHSKIGVFVFTIVAGLLLAALSWVVLFSAGVARRRIRLSLDQPLRALYETIGACGNPPRDESMSFAVFALVFLALSWVVIPIGLFLFLKS
jgi:hypothetical protein